MAISETKGQGWRAISTQWRKASDILTSTLAAFLFSSHPKRERDREAPPSRPTNSVKAWTKHKAPNPTRALASSFLFTTRPVDSEGRSVSPSSLSGHETGEFAPRPVEHQLHRIPKALTGQAMGTRTADSTQVYITYDGWNMKVLVFFTL